MPLSEHEQRILEEIERRLAAEDPKFARDVAAATPQGQAARRIKKLVAGLVVGLGLLIAGLAVPDMLVPLGLAAFAVMLGSVVLIARTAKHVGPRDGRSSGAPTPTWFNRLEERWRRRFERGDGR
jgi:hypothetical protein